jgi:xanthine/uracil permease
MKHEAQKNGDRDGAALGDPRTRLIYGIDDVPPLLQTVTLGFQHYLTMFSSTVAIPLIMSKPLGLDALPGELASLISTMFFIGLSLPEYFGANPVQFEPSWLADLVNTLGKSGMAVGALLAAILDNTIPGTPEERGLHAR